MEKFNLKFPKFSKIDFLQNINQKIFLISSFYIFPKILRKFLLRRGFFLEMWDKQIKMKIVRKIVFFIVAIN